MKQLVKVKVEEVEGEGLLGLMDQRVTLFCMNYIYTGTLVGVNSTFVKLEKASLVFETGPFNNKEWKDAQLLPNDLYIQLSSVEAFCVLK